MALSDARKDLAAALKPALTGFNIFPAPQTLNTITKPTLVLMQTRVEKLPQAPIGHLVHTFSLFVIEPTTTAGASEDALDLLLLDVIEALDERADIRWDTAERDLWNETNPAYRITFTATSTRKETD